MRMIRAAVAILSLTAVSAFTIFIEAQDFFSVTGVKLDADGDTVDLSEGHTFAGQVENPKTFAKIAHGAEVRKGSPARVSYLKDKKFRLNCGRITVEVDLRGKPR